MQEAHVARGLRSIAANVRRLRLARRLTQAQLAETADIEPQTLQVIERGAGNPTAAVLITLAVALGVTPGTLFRAAEPAHRPVGRPRRPRSKRSA
jgi:transcriptional regulator with XRE-family HTH domain